MNAAADPLASFQGVSQVVLDDVRFKQKLGIGEDAYTSLRMARGLGQMWDVGGAAAIGASAAASTTVAGTFFGTSGLLATLGLGAAAVTPLGWVVGAAIVSGGAFYGVSRAMGGYAKSRVEVIPKFINSPIDELGAALLDMMGALALKVASIDGNVDESERAAMIDYFVEVWGYDPTYTARAIDLIAANGLAHPIRPMTEAISRFVADHPDCNFDAFRREIMMLLREIAEADGNLDEREDLAINAIGAALQPKGALESLADLAGSMASGVGHAATEVSKKVKLAGASSAVTGWLAKLPSRPKN